MTRVTRRKTGRSILAVVVLAAGGVAAVAIPSSASFVADISAQSGGQDVDGDLGDTAALGDAGGDAAGITQYDWTDLMTTGNYSVTYGAGVKAQTVNFTGAGKPKATFPDTQYVSSTFVPDFVPGSTADYSTFTNGSKDTLDITGWACVGANNVTNKGDLQNLYAAAFRTTDVDTHGKHHSIVYFGMEKASPNGDNNIGIWIVQDPNVACSNPATGGGGAPFGTTSAGVFTAGKHVVGDVLLVAAFTNGGANPVINAYKWDPTFTNSSSPNLRPLTGTAAVPSGGKCGSSQNVSLCAITNPNSITPPWVTQATNGSAFTQTLAPDLFYEGGVDLTELLGDNVCFDRILGDTRASQSTTSALYDYADGVLPTCGALKVHKYIDNDAENGALTSRTVTDGVTTSTTTLSSASAAFKAADVGDVLTGDGIPVGTTISSVTDATHVVMSAAATKTATGVAVGIAEANGANWSFTVNGPATDPTFPAAGTAGPLLCTGVTGADGFLTCGAND